MISRHSMVSFLTSNKLYLLAVVYSKANEKELDALTAAINLKLVLILAEMTITISN